jgi:hypothetical protein
MDPSTSYASPATRWTSAAAASSNNSMATVPGTTDPLYRPAGSCTPVRTCSPTNNSSGSPNRLLAPPTVMELIHEGNGDLVRATALSIEALSALAR